MSDYAHTRPEREFRQHRHSTLLRKGCQSPRRVEAVCVLGTFWNDLSPTPRMLSRMEAAQSLLLGCNTPTCLIAAGGVNGTGGSLRTEAQMIGRWFSLQGFPHVYREEFSMETIGNIVFSALGFLLPLGIAKVTVVTDECHATRVSTLAHHLLAGWLEVETHSSPWPLSKEERIQEELSEERGKVFVERFTHDVEPGDLVDGFDWVSYHHKSQPYVGIELEAIAAITRGQIGDYGLILHNVPNHPTTAAKFTPEELPLAA